MFGIPTPKFGFMSDPQKLAMFTSGLALLASSEPEKVLQAMPNVMMAAAMAKDRAKQAEYQRAIQQQQLEMQKERLGLTKEQIEMKRQQMAQEQAARQNLMRMLGLSPAPLPGSMAPIQQGEMNGAQKTDQTIASQESSARSQSIAVKIKNLPPAVRAQMAMDPVFRRQVLAKVAFPEQKESRPMPRTVMLPNGSQKTLDISIPEQAEEMRRLIEQGGIVVQPKAELAADPWALKGREYIQKELDEYNALSSTNRAIAQKLPNILGSNVYLGVGADIVGTVGKALRDVAGIGNDIDYDSLKSIKDLHAQLVLKSLGGSLAQGISEGDRRLIEGAQIDTGDSRRDIARIFAERKLIETAASKRLAFLRQRMRSGVDYFDAQREWENILRLRDEGKIDKIPEYARPFVPPRITREVIERSAEKLLSRFGSGDKTLVQQAEQVGSDIKKKVEESQKMPAMTVRAGRDEEALRQLNAARKQRGLKPLSMEEFQAAKQKGLVKVR